MASRDSFVAPPGKVRIQVQVPAGLGPGQMLRVQYGPRQYDVTIPPGVGAGGNFLMEVDAPASQPPPAQPAVPMGLPVQMQRAPAPAPATLNRSQTGRAIVEATPRSQAEMKAECPICFETLCDGPIGVFLGPDNKRVSMHFFNLNAAREWLASGGAQCPLTRNRIASVLEVPDLRQNPNGWFDAVDIDGDNRLSRLEVVECLKAQLPIDGAALDASLTDQSNWMWQQWDPDGSGYIERHELLHPQGLAAYVRTAFERAAREEEIPDINRDKDAWYRYWDEDNSGALDKEEVVRALLKTFRMTSDQQVVLQMRQSIEAIWPLFDDDGSGTIERNEFLRADGLADTVRATLGFG